MTVQDNGEGKGGCTLVVLLRIWVALMVMYLVYSSMK